MEEGRPESDPGVRGVPSVNGYSSPDGWTHSAPGGESHDVFQEPAIRYVVVLILACIAIALSACTSSGVGSNTGSNSSPPNPNFTISYAGAANWLSRLDPAERQEQERDWARLALAAHLRLSTSQVRDATYDTLPVRNPGFAGLAQQDIGTGRYLYDGQGVLHLLVLRGDPNQARTIGLLLDQYRTDAGTDTPQTQVHYYQVNPGTDTIDVAAGPAEPTSRLRTADGYVTMPVNTLGELTSFLTRTSYLSRLGRQGSSIVASGWSWPASPDARMTVADVSALQRGYSATKKAHSQLPGFSLDPQPFWTAKDVLAADPGLSQSQANQFVVANWRAVIPGLSQDLTNRIVNNNWSGSGFQSASDLDNYVNPALFTPLTSTDLSKLSQLGLPTNRTQLLALDSQLQGKASYSQARYEGNLAGTAVGMTLFYTDYVAKNWISGVGTGIPTVSETGFVPDTTAPTVWSECNGHGSEYGREWFGENDSAARPDGNGISIGAEPVRMYVRSDSGPKGNEVEPSYSFGRAVLWWDQHYQAIADYDPQYQRLDQIMRWSDALDWLVHKDSSSLPRLPDSQIPSNQTFANWYHQHNELRERLPVNFVSPPQAQVTAGRTRTTSYGESVSPVPSRPYTHCGQTFYEGGISLSDSSFREGSVDYHPDLPTSVSRGGTFDKASTFNDGTGTGNLKEVSLGDTGTVTSFLDRRFSTSDGTDTVDVTASGRKVAPLGSLKVWRAPTAIRTLGLRILAGRGQISETVDFQGQDLGGLAVRNDIDLVTVQWRPGLVDRVRTVMESIQDELSARPAAGLAGATSGTLHGVLYDYAAPGGQTMYRVGDSDASWLSVTGQGPPAGNDLVFTGGGPSADGSSPVFFFGRLVHGPDLHGDWLEVTPASQGKDASVAPASAPPGPGDQPIRIETPDGKSADVHQRNGQLLVRADDRVVGLNGSPEGAALLRDFPQVLTAMRGATQANDGLLRAVDLDGDGVALASADTVTLLPPDHPWATRVEEVADSHGSSIPLFLIRDGQLLYAVKENLIPVAGSHKVVMNLGDAMRMSGQTLYMDSEAFRSTLLSEDGPVISSTLPLSTRVTVWQFVNTGSHHIQPDALVNHGVTWVRTSAAASSSSGPTAAPTPTPALTPGPAAGTPAPGAPILLVCPVSTSNLPGCNNQ